MAEPITEPGPSETSRNPPQRHEPERWELIRDVLTFQLKLGLDGLRDLLLSPVSILLALIGLVFESDRPGRLFYALLQWGHKTDRWIGLFSAADDYPDNESGGQNADRVIGKVRKVVADEINKTGQADRLKSGVDRLLDLIRLK